MRQTLLKSFLLLCSLIVGSVAWADDFELYSGALTEGDYIIFYGDKAMNATVSNNRLQYLVVKPENNKISTTESSIVWHIAASGDYWTLYNANAKKYAASNGTKNQAAVLDDATDDKALWTVSGTETYEFVNKANAAGNVNSTLRNNTTYGFACYATGTGGPLYLYKKVDSATPTCDAPTFSPAAGTFTSAQEVTINTTTEGATIFYTLDESVPTTESTQYTSAITVSETTTIKAIAVKDGYDNSSVASATYKIVNINHAGILEDPYTVADAINAIDLNTGFTSVYAKGIVSKIVTAYNPKYGNITYNISADGTTEGLQLQAYRGKGKNGDWFTSEYDIQVGDEVIIFGNLKKYNSTYEFDTDNQLVSLIRKPYSITIGEAGYATMYLPSAVKYDEEQLTESPNVYIAQITGKNLTLVEVNGTIPANTAVILKGAPGTYSYAIAEGVEPIKDNDLQGTLEPIEANGTQYVLAKVNDVVGFYKATGTIPAGKAYIELPVTEVKAFYFDDEEETSIVSPLGETEEGVAIYNLAGQRISKLQKGINIVGGKKVLK